MLTLSYFGPSIPDGDGCNFQPNGSIKLKFFVNPTEFWACCPSGILVIAKCMCVVHFIGNQTY